MLAKKVCVDLNLKPELEEIAQLDGHPARFKRILGANDCLLVLVRTSG